MAFLLKRLAIWVLGDFWGLGGVFLGFSGKLGFGEGILGGILCVATRNLLLKRLAFRGFGRGGGILGGFCV